MCLGRFIQGRLFDFVHHFAILRRELVFDLFLKLTSILSILGHFQESLSLEELTQVLTNIFHSDIATRCTLGLVTVLLFERILGRARGQHPLTSEAGVPFD